MYRSAYWARSKICVKRRGFIVSGSVGVKHQGDMRRMCESESCKVAVVVAVTAALKSDTQWLWRHTHRQAHARRRVVVLVTVLELVREELFHLRAHSLRLQ